MSNYSLQGDNYIIKNYDKVPAFSSFLPGLAGVKGIPLWVYYTNRGQGINSFGIHNKNNAIMEFNPANTAYENTAIKGFRTFIKCNGTYFEPFFTLEKSTKRNLYIRKNSFVIEEINEQFGLKIRVKYFVLPNDSIGALVRNVQIENITKDVKEIELIDGLPKIIPFGIKNNEYKEMSNLLKSWTEIKNLENNVPFYTLRASSDDSSEVLDVEDGYYYLSIHNQQILPVLYDPEVIFDYDTSLVNPIEFMNQSLEEVMGKEQCFYNKIPCGFTPLKFTLAPSEQYKFSTMIGFANSPEQINEKLGEFCEAEYFSKKEQQADEIVDKLTMDVRTHTSKPAFDQYIENSYLDNFLRGGYPFVFNKASNKAVVHLFNRKHGDPERDYNFFSIAGEYYSQGNGNFRDVSQNRRNDVFFQKDIEDFNVKTFFQLIQIDGYNPLEVRPSTFLVKMECKEAVDKLLQDNIKNKIDKIKKIVTKLFTPGQIANCIALNHIDVTCGEDVLLEKILDNCNQNIEAGFHEGYWSDHWDYNMDLIDNYLSIYPDHEISLLFHDSSYRFYDSPARVLPRSEKYVISKNEVRQYGSLVLDEDKMNLVGFVKNGTNWLKTKAGDIAETTLMAKLISLALNKFSTLDSFGMGIEMEAGKPGWNDAMNGLPGIIGSGMSETFELKRMITFICNTVTGESTVTLPIEISEFLLNVSSTLKQSKAEDWNSFTYWDSVSTLREEYREKTRFTIEGEYCQIDTLKIQEIYDEFLEKIEIGIQKACQYGDGIVPTYFTYRATRFEEVVDATGLLVMSHYGLPKAKVKEFEAQPLPAFLEGPAKMLGIMKDKEAAEELYNNVKNSDIYDTKLKMYKTSGSLEQVSMENGRIRAFTAGWLERESVFLHMEYKYLLSMIRAGLYEKYYEDIQTALIPFLEPEVYGRSILENSSFLASSVNPNCLLHGRGYVARLSGSTTEAISMWIEMFIGGKIFTYEDGVLKLHFEPKLSGWMFDENGNVSFMLLSKCKVTYQNPDHKSTFGENSAQITSIVIKEFDQEIKGNVLSGELAERVRSGEIKEIMVHMA